jgi:hypothetical protein
MATTIGPKYPQFISIPRASSREDALRAARREKILRWNAVRDMLKDGFVEHDENCNFEFPPGESPEEIAREIQALGREIRQARR